MRRQAMSSIALSVLLLAPIPAGGQSVLLPPGSTVRFRIHPADPPHQATLETLTADSLILQRCETCTGLRFARTQVSHLELLRDRPAGPRLAAGFGIGGLIGLGLGALAANSCHGIGDTCDGSVLAVPLLGILGAMIGALAGFLTAYKWVPIG
jgi:hypothetical protein